VPTQRERTAASRQAILDAAVRLIGEGGYRAATTTRIEDVSGVSRGLVGYHFRSKAGLTDAVVREVNEAFLARIGGLEVSSRPTGLDGVTTLLRGYLQRLGADPRLHRVMLVLIVESLAGQPELQDAVRANNELLRSALREQFARGVADGSVRSDVDPAVEAAVVAGTGRGLVLQWLADPEGVDLDAVTARAVAAVERAYGSTAG
jgi:AcrR family transcriptional regulator